MDEHVLPDATACRSQVAEDGPDTFNSESDSDNEQHGDVIMDACVGIKTDSNGNPISAEHKISNEQAEAQRRAAQSVAPRPQVNTSRMDSDSRAPVRRRVEQRIGTYLGYVA
jgi:hypothetical protein